MTNFGFWNVNSLHDLDTDVRQMPRIGADLVFQHSLDIIFLIECKLSYSSLLAELYSRQEYFPVDCADRFKVLVNFNPAFMVRLQAHLMNNRFEIWHLMLPLQESVLLVLLHGLDQRNRDNETNELFMGQVVEAISLYERQVGHDRTIVLGDFNANPFDSPVASVRGMHAVMSKSIAQKPARQLLQKDYPFFYNPMWRLYGKESDEQSPASYYYQGSNSNELYWHMLDQVILRPTLIGRFDDSSLNIITNVGDKTLLMPSEIPNNSRYSDHLPVVFSLDMTHINEKGD